MIPELAPGLAAAVEGEQVDIRELLAEQPTFAVALSESKLARDAARLVVMDTLARFCEGRETTVEARLHALLARLHAWDATLVVGP